MSIRLAAVTLATAAAVGLTAGLSPEIAQGFIVGRYQVEACTEAVSFANDTWTVSTNNSDLETHTSCGEQPAPYQSTVIADLEIADIVGLTKELPVGAEGAWQVIAPAGETIAEVTGYSSLFRTGGDAWQVYRESEATNGKITIEQTCKGVHTDSCGIGGPFQAAGLHARRFAFGARCEAEEYEPGKFFTTCPDGGTIHDVRAGINYATVTLEDLNPPTNVTASSIPAGPQHSTISISGSAEDHLAGLLSLSIIDSERHSVAGPISVPGDCDYSKFVPCPVTASDIAIPLDTEKLPEGEDHLRLVAVNAAHDEGFSEPFTVDVDNRVEEPNGGGGGKSSSEEKPQPKESGTGGGQTGGSSSGSGGQTGQEQKSGSKPLPALLLRVGRLRVHRHYLRLSGTTQASALGWLRLIFHFHGPGRHETSLARRVAIHDGHFTARLLLPARCPDETELRIEYSGDRAIRSTNSHRRLPLPACH
jgi:hypothetical protein